MDAFNPNPFAVGGDTTQTQAILALYTPRIYGDQVLRPFVYGFTEQAVDKLMGGGDTLEKAFANPRVATSQEIANIIKPDQTGVKMRMDEMSTFWTFMLMIRRPNNYDGVSMSASGFKTVVLCGHCLDEPVAPNTLYMTTPTINPNCRLVVHSRQELSAAGSTMSAFGMYRPTSVLNSDDIIDPSLQMLAQTMTPNGMVGTDLFITTPYNVLTNFDSSAANAGTISTPGVCSVMNSNRCPVQASLKTPGVHLKHILQSLDTEVAMMQNEQFAPRSFGSMGALSPAEDVDMFKADVVNNLGQYSIGSEIQTDGLDTKSILTIGQIQMAYPGLVVSPQRVADHAVAPNGTFMEVLPQTIMNPKVMYSSFASSAIGSIAADCGLGSISFGYTSHDPSKVGCPDKSTFQVVPDMTMLICPSPNPEQAAHQLKASVEMFRVLFQKNVAPFIQGTVGEFQICANHSNNGETHVDLQLLDYGSNTNLGNVWYEAPNRLSSLTSTMLGTESVFMNNGFSLDTFVKQAQSRAGCSAMGITSPAPTGNLEDAPVTVADPMGGFGGF